MEIVSERRKLAMSGLAAVLAVFVTSPYLILPSSIQECVLYALCAILLCHMAKTVLFSTNIVAGYLANVSEVLLQLLVDMHDI